MTSWRPPASRAKQDELAITYARDGYALLEAVYHDSSPAWLAEVPAVDVLRRVLLQNYTRVIRADGREVIRRREKEPEGDGLPPGHARIASPYDLDARWGVKRDTFWLGYKLHVTETCDDQPRCGCPGDGRAGRRGHDKEPRPAARKPLQLAGGAVAKPLLPMLQRLFGKVRSAAHCALGVKYHWSPPDVPA